MEDLRVRRTKKSIVQAFYHLLTKENFNKITIQQIADEAMINRQTFYLHYQDKYDLLQQIVDNLSQRATRVLKEQINNLQQTITQTFNKHYNDLVNNKDKMDILLSQNYCNTVLRQTMRRDLLHYLKKQDKLQLTDFQAKVIAVNFIELIMILYSSKKIPSEKEINELYDLLRKIVF